MDIFGLLRVTWLPSARRRGVPIAPPEVAVTEPPPVPKPVPEPPVYEPPVKAARGWHAPAAHPPAAAAVAPPPDIVEGLIRLTDDLLDLTEHASGPESDARALRLVQRRVERLLADCGARIVRDDGPVNASRHTVVAVRPATADGPEGWIAGTVRPGYLHGGQLIRPQQVVAYTIEQPAGTMEGNDHEG